MLYFLENLVNLPKVSIQNVVQEGQDVFLMLGCTEEVVKCNSCGILTDELHQTRHIMVRDLPISGQIVHLKVPRRKFYCRNCQSYFTEDLEFLSPRRKYTERYEKYIYQRVNASNIEQVKREESLSWDQVQGIYKHQCEALKKNWNEVKHLGMDEIAKRKGHKNFVTVVGDMDKGVLIDVIDSHEQGEIIETIMKQPLEIREKVEEVSIDMWGGFPGVIKEVFPKAKIVTDKFHVIKAVNEELNKIRKQTKFKIRIRGVKNLLLKNNENLSKEQSEELELVLKQSKRLRQAYDFKESLRKIYENAKDPEEGKSAILDWLKNASRIYTDVVTTIKNHLDYICNYFLSGTTNGPMEGINNRLKLIKRQAYGFVSFENMRYRFLACFSS